MSTSLSFLDLIALMNFSLLLQKSQRKDLVCLKSVEERRDVEVQRVGVILHSETGKNFTSSTEVSFPAKEVNRD